MKGRSAGRADALRQARQALNFLQHSTSFPLQRINFLQDVYFLNADVHRALGNTDSFYIYFQLYASLHDSLERVAARSNSKITQMRIENEENYHAIQSLQKEKSAEKVKRNFIIAAIILLSVIVFLYINRLRLKYKHKELLSLQQKEKAQSEIAAAKEQLDMFTQNIIEKSNLIEKLEQQVKSNVINAEQQKLTDELSHQTIVTEDDWNKFKSLYEKIYPGFFAKLRSKAHDITVAELRMAALTRLQLTNSQMASMLGISPDSVRKTRLRLRQRLNLPVDSNLEEHDRRYLIGPDLIINTLKKNSFQACPAFVPPLSLICLSKNLVFAIAAGLSLKSGRNNISAGLK